jgi:hypothetical protein
LKHLAFYIIRGIEIILVIFTSILVACQSTKGTQTPVCQKCDENLLANLKIPSGNVRRDLKLLFCTNDTTCQNNIEFSEYYNEMLYLYLECHPGEFIHQWYLSSDSQQRLVLHELAHPISDQLQVSAILEKVKQLNDPKSKPIVEVLKAAVEER